MSDVQGSGQPLSICSTFGDGSNRLLRMQEHLLSGTSYSPYLMSEEYTRPLIKREFAIRSHRTHLDSFFHSMVSFLQEKLYLLDSNLLQSGLTLVCTPTGLGFMCRRWEDQRPYDMVISFDWFSSYAGPNIMALFPAFLLIFKAAFSDVRQVDVIHSAALSEERMIELLRPYRSVKTLYMAMSDTVEHLLPAMNLRDMDVDWVPFPVLETIVLEHAFKLGERAHTAEVDGLMDLIRARSKTKYAIRNVQFSHCGHVFTTIRALESLGINTIYSGQ